MTPERKAKLTAVLNRRQPDLTLIADQVHKPRNVAALVRNADAVGIHRIHCIAPKEGYRFRGTTQGSDRWVETVNHDSFSGAISTVREQGMQIYAAHFSPRAVDYRQVDYTLPCAILMGAEKYGVSDQAAEQADEHILIPMMGMVGSLNVSTAAGIILVEAQQQRMQAGLYEQPRLSDQERARKLFEWGHEKLVQFCRERNLAYPPYDLDGEMIDAPGWNRLVQQGTAPRQRW
ncbi:MAG: tRNA (guanosine(18)-2'-O)-methyltransferase TrmH [Marinobacterium sp.]|nr:tRNA (guanosine(18)-2'-O)-methyltransferase TrmH [Marinobacterium sp.]